MTLQEKILKIEETSAKYVIKRNDFKMMNTKKKRKIIGIVAVVYFLLVIVVLVLVKFPDAEKIESQTDEVAAVAEGRRILGKYDSQDTEDVENVVRSVQEEIARREAIAANADQGSGQADLAQAFANAVVIGDSQAEALEAYQVLPSASVAATIGRSIVTAEDDYNKTVVRSPKYVFVTYGMNDCLIYGGDVEKFIDVYSDLVARLQADIPDVRVIICSLILPSDAAVQKKPALANVTNYNVALQQLASQLGLAYIDCTPIVKTDLYAQDGLHMQKSFYQAWAYYMASYAGLLN